MPHRRHSLNSAAPLIGFALCAVLWLHGCAQKPAQQRHFSLRLVATDTAGGGDAAISPDGQRFVCSSKRSGNWDVWMYELATQEWTRVTSDPADDFEAQWSPDGSRLAFTSTRTGNKDVWVISLADRQERRLTDSPDDDEYPSWSPDGKYIAYTAGPWKERNFCIVPADGGPVRKLKGGAGMAGACSFVPDGQSLVCHAYNTGSGMLSRLSLGQDEMSQLTDGKDWDYKPSASPDGKWLAFSRSQNGKSAIWVMPLSGGEARPITFQDADDRWPTWSASGQALLFHRISDHSGGITVLDRATNQTRTVVPADENPTAAAFDPRAQKVVYCARAQGRQVIRIRDLSTGESSTLDTGPENADFPRWSPDGKTIAFLQKVGARWEVCTIHADGGERRMWTGPDRPAKDISGPFDWSPDGTKIVFKADTAPFESDLYILDTTNGEIRNLTNDAWFDESPSWTPDGAAILFMSTRGGNWTWGLFRWSLKDGAVTQVAAPDYTEKNFPRADADGRVVWSFYKESGVEMLAERTAAGKTSVLESAGPGARWPSFSADGRLLLFTTFAHRIEYWLADDVFAAGSPLLQDGQAGATTQAAATEGEPQPLAPDWTLRPSVVRISPVDLHHR